jgi:hypothetical protein
MEMMFFRKKKTSLWKDVLIGLIAGWIGTLAMDLFQRWFSALITGGEETQADEAAGKQPLDSIAVAGEHHREDESSTAALGRMAYADTTGEEPNKATKSILSYLVHWLYGTLQGSLYSLVGKRLNLPDWVSGPLFGTGLWLLGDELVVPMLGLQKGPTAYSWRTHLNRLAMHLVYGAVTAFSAKLLRRFV